ncbi:fimbria/pilus outer membrane usher protein [Oceanisphaera sp. KMM 10153]|uniref:fimbria/pilus outer membrane usher protein n=1 Tax=Oceanisphaera submarina TaxID=3390193 RepID=UPI003976DACC
MNNLIKATRKGDRARFGSEKAHSIALTPLACVICSLLATAPAVVFAETQAAAAHGGFDIEMLRQRGIDPKLAEYFREAAKFTEGVRLVSLVVNGVKLGRVDARFDSQGRLIFNDNLLAKARLRVPASKFVLGGEGEGEGEGDPRYDFVGAYPQTEVTLRPNQEEIFLVVPQEALLGDAPEAGHFSRGGTAGILNYDLLGMRSSFDGGSQDYLSASTEVGFNMGDWIVRSRQMYTRDQDSTRFDQLYTYAQRTLPEYKAVVQGGEININSPVFAGAPITGFQFVPETALLNDSSTGAVVDGIAQSQATVEVRQAGVLVYTTLVPEGPFSLTGIPLLNTGTDLDVTVRETDGGERRFVVPAASFRTTVRTQPGYSFALGKVRDLSDGDGKEPLLATVAGAKNLGAGLTGVAGAMLTEEYQSVGGGADVALRRDTSLSVRNLYANASEEGMTGTQFSVSVGTRLTEKLSTSVSATQQTPGYRELSDTLLDELDGDPFRGRLQRQYTASLGWSDAMLGGFNLSYSTSRSFDDYASNRLTGSWGRSFRHATVTASVETSMGGSGNGADEGDAVYLSVSVPFGSRSVRAYTSRRGDTLRTGVALTDVVNEQVSYRVAAERTDDGGRSGGSNYGSANLSLLPRYAAVDLGYARSGTSTTYNGRISGGVVAHKDGVTLSPYQLQDTFGIVDVGDVSGVKISTPSGPVWTDGAGQAVLPQLHAYRNSRIEVQTASLPRNVDLRNGYQSIEAGRGSVSHLAFDVIQARRVLVTAVDDGNQPLPMGSSVLDTGNNFITSVLDNGTVFLSDADPKQVLKVSLPDDKTCTLTIDFPEESDDEAFYDEAPAVCRA